MASFREHVLAGVVNCGLYGSRVLVGVSGGADSVALLCGLLELQNEHQLEVVAAHLNHQLRGEQSTDDAAWVESLCAKLGVRLILESRDVAKIASQQGRGLEETARKLRYEFLTESADREDCQHVAVAHTADDQAETILHHILRGTGIAGLAGIPTTRSLSESITLVRPLLTVTRGDVEEYLNDIGQDFRTDESNEEQSFTRNRIRHSLLPLLRQEFNPQVERALLRLGRQAADAQAAIEQIAARMLAAAVVDRNETTCRLDCSHLADQPLHLVRECVSLLWKQQDWPRRRMGFAEWNRIAEMIGAEEGETYTLPGSIEVTRRGNLLVLRRVGAHLI